MQRTFTTAFLAVLLALAALLRLRKMTPRRPAKRRRPRPRHLKLPRIWLPRDAWTRRWRSLIYWQPRPPRRLVWNGCAASYFTNKSSSGGYCSLH